MQSRGCQSTGKATSAGPREREREREEEEEREKEKEKEREEEKGKEKEKERDVLSPPARGLAKHFRGRGRQYLEASHELSSL